MRSKGDVTAAKEEDTREEGEGQMIFPRGDETLLSSDLSAFQDNVGMNFFIVAKSNISLRSYVTQIHRLIVHNDWLLFVTI